VDKLLPNVVRPPRIDSDISTFQEALNRDDRQRDGEWVAGMAKDATSTSSMPERVTSILAVDRKKQPKINWVWTAP
jgi:hypothetical protein